MPIGSLLIYETAADATQALADAAALEMKRVGSWYYRAENFIPHVAADAAGTSGGDVRSDSVKGASPQQLSLGDAAVEMRGAIGWFFVPVGATSYTITHRGRALVAPAADVTVRLCMKFRAKIDGIATPVWGAQVNLTDETIATGDVTGQTYTRIYALAALGLTAGVWYQLAVGRDGTADSLVNDYEFTDIAGVPS